MFHYHLTPVAAVPHGLFYVDTRLRVPALLEQNPRIRVQIRRVLRFLLHGDEAHLLRLVEVSALHRQIIRIIVQRIDVLRIIHQRRIICRIRLRLHPALMIQVAKDRIEIRCYSLVALPVYLLHPLAEHLQRLLRLLLLIVSHSEIIIELHRVRTVHQGRFRHTDHPVRIIPADGITQQLQPRRLVLRVDAQHPVEHRHRFLLHLLRYQILRIEHRHVRRSLLPAHHLLEQADNLRAVPVRLFRFQNQLSHEVHLHPRLHIPVHQDRICLHRIQAVLPRFPVIRSQRNHGRRIVRFLLQNRAVHLQRLVVAPHGEIHIAHHRPVAHVVRIFVRERLNLAERLLHIVHLQIRPELLHAYLFRLPVQLLYAVQHSHQAVITLHPSVQVRQREQRFEPCRKYLRHVLVDGDSLHPVLLLQIIRRQRLLVPEIAVVPAHRHLQSFLAPLLLPREHIELRQLIHHCSRTWINLQTASVQLEGSIIFALLLHAHRLEKIIVKLPALPVRQRIPELRRRLVRRTLPVPEGST